MSNNRKKWLLAFIMTIIVSCLMTYFLHWIANNLIFDTTIRQAFSQLFSPFYIGAAIFLACIALVNFITNKRTK